MAFFHLSPSILPALSGFKLDTSFPATYMPSFHPALRPAKESPDSYITHTFNPTPIRGAFVLCCEFDKFDPATKLIHFSRRIKPVDIRGIMSGNSHLEFDGKSTDATTIIDMTNCELVSSNSGSPIIINNNNVIGIVASSKFEFPEPSRKKEASAIHSIEIFECLKSFYRESAIPAIYQGLQPEIIIGDGDCLYRAVTYYLGQGEDVAFLRNRVATNLEQNAALREFAPLANGQTLPQYIANIRSTHQWADNLEINILMRLLDRPIVVIGPEGTIRNVNEVRQYPGEPIFVYYNGVDHYDVFTLRGGYDGRTILIEMLQEDPSIHHHEILQPSLMGVEGIGLFIIASSHQT